MEAIINGVLSDLDFAAPLKTTLTGVVLDGSMIVECGRCLESVESVFISGVISRLSSSVK